jgi:UDP-N-acetyl-D-mannosaminuronic acid dehydrogenase
MKKVCILGLGYIGLPTAGLLAAKGFSVHGVDKDPKVVDAVNKSYPHIHEPGLSNLLKLAVQSGNLVASLEPVHADIFIITVPSLITKEHLPDITHIKEAIHAIASYLTPGCLVIIETTVPVGTTEKIAGLLSQLRRDLIIPSITSTISRIDKEKQIFLAHCPERVSPGRTLIELVENSRVIGGIDQLSGQKAYLFYKHFVCGELFITNARTAELTKLTENSFRDVNIAFANELSLICANLGINVWELLKLANSHPRVSILDPGPGVGGHCLPKDSWFIKHAAPELARIIHTAREINDCMPNQIIVQIKSKAACFQEPVIACLGLTYKSNTDDLRESPALKIVKQLLDEKVGEILIIEPHIEALPNTLANHDGVKLVDLQEGLAQANLVVLLVAHDTFKNIEENILKKKVVVDTRGMWL